MPRSFFSGEALQCVEMRNIYIIYMYIYEYIYLYLYINTYLYIYHVHSYIYVLYILYYVKYVYLYILYVFIIMCIPGKPWNTILLFSRVKIEFWFFSIFIWLPHGQPHPITMLITACLRFWPKGYKELYKPGQMKCSLDLAR